LAEAYRNVAVTGAIPVAVTDCLNFGSPEDPHVMWQFAEAVRGLADGCQDLGIPVTGGNVSFYNQTGAVPIDPTPIVGVLGLIDDVNNRVPIGFGHDGDTLLLLGETRAELSGSQWALVEHQHLGGLPPRVDFHREKQICTVIAEAARHGLLTAAHDVSDGGLAQTIVESCLRGGHGVALTLPDGTDPFVMLFSESSGRAVVSVRRGQVAALAALCQEYGLPAVTIGSVQSAGDLFEVRGVFAVPVAELRTAWTETLHELFGRTEPDDVAANAVADLAPHATAAGEMSAADGVATAPVGSSPRGGGSRDAPVHRAGVLHGSGAAPSRQAAQPAAVERDMLDQAPVEAPASDEDVRQGVLADEPVADDHGSDDVRPGGEVDVAPTDLDAADVDHADLDHADIDHGGAKSDAVQDAAATSEDEVAEAEVLEPDAGAEAEAPQGIDPHDDVIEAEIVGESRDESA
jgi:phosphoribosylformylglycinamidine synthase